MNCVSKSEGHRQLIQGLQNLGKNRETDRSTDKKVVTYSEYEKTSLIYLLRTIFIDFFQSSMNYTAVYQQQHTVHGAHQNSSTVGND